MPDLGLFRGSSLPLFLGVLHMIIAHKSAFMQRIQEAAAHGYEWVITGSIDIHKFDNLYRKMKQLGMSDE